MEIQKIVAEDYWNVNMVKSNNLTHTQGRPSIDDTKHNSQARDQRPLKQESSSQHPIPRISELHIIEVLQLTTNSS